MPPGIGIMLVLRWNMTHTDPPIVSTTMTAVNRNASSVQPPLGAGVQVQEADDMDDDLHQREREDHRGGPARRGPLLRHDKPEGHDREDDRQQRADPVAAAAAVTHRVAVRVGA